MWRRERPDPQRIHWLEYELGYRDDPPPMPFQTPTDEPGRIVWHNPPRHAMRYAPSRERKALYQSLRAEMPRKARSDLLRSMKKRGADFYF